MIIMGMGSYPEWSPSCKIEYTPHHSGTSTWRCSVIASFQATRCWRWSLRGPSLRTAARPSLGSVVHWGGCCGCGLRWTTWRQLRWGCHRWWDVVWRIWCWRCPGRWSTAARSSPCPWWSLGLGSCHSRGMLPWILPTRRHCVTRWPWPDLEEWGPCTRQT